MLSKTSIIIQVPKYEIQDTSNEFKSIKCVLAQFSP